MAECKVPRIDRMIGGQDETPIVPDGGATKSDAVGIIQDLLKCNGYPGVPDVSSPEYGLWNKTTVNRLRNYRLKNQLQKAKDPVWLDAQTLLSLFSGLQRASSYLANRAYVTLGLDFQFTELLRVLTFVAVAEGRGEFKAFNRNTDHKGLSYGIIQWAQNNVPVFQNEMKIALERVDFASKTATQWRAARRAGRKNIPLWPHSQLSI